jgi:hypothetical protein
MTVRNVSRGLEGGQGADLRFQSGGWIKGVFLTECSFFVSPDLLKDRAFSVGISISVVLVACK